MKIVIAEQQPESPNPHGIVARAVHSTEHTQVSHLTFQVGEKLRWHITPVDAFFFVIEGEAQVEIGDESEVVPAGALVHSPAGTKHRILNHGDGELRVLVVKTPAQTTGTQLL
ncbi:MAG: cupin domain-containing protein [Chloroflexi bacterium]|jgi:mannose-6-phosphate isomerase-like protein (cupin superfamily)|nr:cupin domain-containing protein [Chloroflexota bacterium]